MFGVGINSGTVYKISEKGKYLKVHTVWVEMLRRCYCDNYQITRPSYIGCSVIDAWHDFQNFAEWFYENYVENFVLDKDILFKGNKIYGPDTCCFVPNEINALFILRKNDRGNLPIGVCLKKQNNKFQGKIQKFGKSVFLGYYLTIEEAFNSYKIAKENYIVELANIWKNKITPKTYNALINYKIEIID